MDSGSGSRSGSGDSDGRRRNYVVEIAAVFAIYVGAFYVLPRDFGGSYPIAPIHWGNICYNTLFYPLRRITRSKTERREGWVEHIDSDKRTLTVMSAPQYGYFVRYRRRDAQAISELRQFDRIRVTIALLPKVQTGDYAQEFRGYERLPGEEDGD